MILSRTSGATDNASAYGAEDCRFESCLVQKLFLHFSTKEDYSQSYLYEQKKVCTLSLQNGYHKIDVSFHAIDHYKIESYIHANGINSIKTP